MRCPTWLLLWAPTTKFALDLMGVAFSHHLFCGGAKASGVILAHFLCFSGWYELLGGLPCQASLSVNICMRMAPTKAQMITDALAWSDELRTLSISGCDDLTDMVVKMMQLFPIQPKTNQRVSATVVEQKCAEWGIRWQGVPFSKDVWHRLVHIFPYAYDDGFLSAIGEIKRLCPKFHNLSTVSCCCLATTNFMKGGFVCDEWIEKKADVMTIQWCLEWFFWSYSFVDIKKDQVTNNILVGARKQDAGTWQVRTVIGMATRRPQIWALSEYR